MKIIPGLEDSRVQRALSVLRESVLEHFPDATFAVETGGEPNGVYLIVTADVEYTSDVVEAVIDQILDVQVEQYLPVYVIVHHSPNAATVHDTHQDEAVVA